MEDPIFQYVNNDEDEEISRVEVVVDGQESFPIINAINIYPSGLVEVWVPGDSSVATCFYHVKTHKVVVIRHLNE